MFTLEKFDEIIKEWMHKHIHNSPVSQSEPAFNHLQSAVGALREQVAQHVDAAPADAAHVDPPEALPAEPQQDDEE